MSTRTDSVTVADGVFDLYVWLPERGTGPGVLLIQEIFGVGDHLRGVAEDLARLGYVVAAPDLFWRIRPGWASDADPEGIQRSMEVSAQFDGEQGVADLEAALDHLAGLPEVTGGTATLGFCLGGWLAYFLAARRPDLAALVSFYGSQVPGALDLATQIRCPAQFHFGGSDPYIPREDIARVERAVAAMPDAEIHVEEEAGHAFHNPSPVFHHAAAADRAWRLTEEFLARRLPV
ncbi:dienelactone hydrolase family protein [Thermomonospora umbrina]|uniref:Carboxymethylenebutenolidase n=1 Tax=Thermomonospora umbrina TaxID=111806 RepID=A0A3D9SQK9_9ACTN|nr:dienelactone hydrolase family protein [Thermomonospora umbrina]REE96780.1 carboxymethylenebutenolidase [Thermomonospora umbrina]